MPNTVDRPSPVPEPAPVPGNHCADKDQPGTKPATGADIGANCAFSRVRLLCGIEFHFHRDLHVFISNKIDDAYLLHPPSFTRETCQL